METAANLLIAIDAGHGGWDVGAQFEGSLEKDDNLRLAVELEKAIRLQGIQVLMTRSEDVFVSLTRRAQTANEADADFFLSLHRSFFPKLNDMTNGVEGFIYLTAPPETSGRAAQLMLGELEEVGVQRMIGVSRGNYPVLRRTEMPSVLLEMGCLGDREDNRLFAENLTRYARAITRGLLQYFGLTFREAPEQEAQAPVNGNHPADSEKNDIYDIQELLEQRYGFGLRPTGRFDASTRRAALLALQIELNGAFDAQIPVNGELRSSTRKAYRAVRPGSKGGLAALVQALLILNGYEPGEVDGNFGRRTVTALRFFQRDRYISPTGVADWETLSALMGPA